MTTSTTMTTITFTWTPIMAIIISGRASLSRQNDEHSMFYSNPRIDNCLCVRVFSSSSFRRIELLCIKPQRVINFEFIPIRWVSIEVCFIPIQFLFYSWAAAVRRVHFHLMHLNTLWNDVHSIVWCECGLKIRCN